MKKIIIFDFDDTLYSGDIDKSKHYDYKMLRNMFAELNDKEFSNLCKKHNIKRKSQVTDDLCVEIALKEGKDPFKTVSQYLEKNNENFQATSNTKIISNDTLSVLREKGYDVYIVSNSPHISVKRNAQALGLDLSLVSIYGMPYRVPYDKYRSASKIDRYQIIANKEGVDPKNITVFGNHLEADIIPALQLKMHGVVCNRADLLTPENIEMCINDRNIFNIEQVTSKEYQEAHKSKNTEMKKESILQKQKEMPKIKVPEYGREQVVMERERGSRYGQ